MTSPDSAQQSSLLLQHFRHSSTAISFFDNQRNIIFANPAFLNIFGYSEQEMFGRNLTEFMTADEVQQSQARHKEVINTSEAEYTIKNRKFLTKTGKTVVLNLRVDRSFGTDNQGAYIFATASVINPQESDQEFIKAIDSEISVLFESSPVGIIVLDENRRYLRANPAYQRLLGYTEDELKKLTIFDTTHADDLGETTKVSSNLKSNEVQINRFSKRKVRKNGQAIWVEITSRAIQGNRLISIVEDVTSRKESEQARDQALNELETLFKCMSEGLVLQDTSGRIIQSNEASLAILGLTKDEITGRSSIDKRWKAIKEDGSDYPGEEHPAMLSLKTGKALKDVHMGVHKRDGSLSWISINSNPIFTEGHPMPISVLTTFADITDRVNSEKALLQASKMAALGEMAAGLAHEINNPLAIIAGKTSLIQSYLKDPTVNKKSIETALERINNTVERIGKIIKGLRTFARSGDNEKMERTPFNRILTETIPLMEERIKNSTIRMTCASFPEVDINCRSVQIAQVLVNLLNNAFDAVQDQKNPWIKIDFEIVHKTLLRVYITDSGPGIPAHIAEKIMTPFFTTKEVGKGTGLGLSISQSIMVAHLGRLILDDSKPNTCFVLELPLYQESIAV